MSMEPYALSVSFWHVASVLPLWGFCFWVESVSVLFSGAPGKTELAAFWFHSAVDRGGCYVA